MGEYAKAAKELLASYAAFFDAMEMDAADLERFNSVCAAISFGSAA